MRACERNTLTDNEAGDPFLMCETLGCSLATLCDEQVETGSTSSQ